MNNNDLLFKKGIYISIIVFSICFLIMFAFLPYFMIDRTYEVFTALFVCSCILLSISAVAVFAMSIIMIVKICSDNSISTSDKVIWSILSYALNTFALPFAYEKCISKSNNYKSATKLAIFHGVALVLSVFGYMLFFIRMIDALNF